MCVLSLLSMWRQPRLAVSGKLARGAAFHLCSGRCASGGRGSASPHHAVHSTHTRARTHTASHFFIVAIEAWEKSHLLQPGSSIKHPTSAAVP